MSKKRKFFVLPNFTHSGQPIRRTSIVSEKKGQPARFEMYRKTNAFFDTLLFAGCPFTYIIIRDLRKQHLCAYQYFTLERISLYVGKGHFSLAVTSSSSSQYSRSFLISARITSLWNTAHSYSFANFSVFARSRESVSVAAPAALHSEESFTASFFSSSGQSSGHTAFMLSLSDSSFRTSF